MNDLTEEDYDRVKDEFTRIINIPGVTSLTFNRMFLAYKTPYNEAKVSQLLENGNVNRSWYKKSSLCVCSTMEESLRLEVHLVSLGYAIFPNITEKKFDDAYQSNRILYSTMF